jgi:hypothetical protein
MVEIDLQTTKFVHFCNQRAIYNQKKYHIDILGQLQFLTVIGAPDNPKIKKKNKYAKIDFTSYHSFLSVRRDQFLPNCKKTHPIAHMVCINNFFFVLKLSICVSIFFYIMTIFLHKQKI